MSYDIGQASARDTVHHFVTVKVSGGEPITFTERSWRGEEYDTETRFQPNMLTLTWDWEPMNNDMGNGYWELVTFKVSGFRLNKDGSMNQRMLKESAIYNKRRMIDVGTPAEFIALVTEHFPKWKPVATS